MGRIESFSFSALQAEKKMFRDNNNEKKTKNPVVSHSDLKRALALPPSEGQSAPALPAPLMDVLGLVYSAEYRYRLVGVGGGREARRAASVTWFRICLPGRNEKIVKVKKKNIYIYSIFTPFYIAGTY